MWLLTAVGSVHGQDHFTYVLEQNQSYTIGRDKTCAIRFDGKTVRPKEGVLEVEGWNPTDPKTPPVLAWKSEAKKDGNFPTRKVMTLEEDAQGLLDKSEYGLSEIHVQGVWLENHMGLEFNSDNWFFMEWVDMSLQYDQMKNEPPHIKESLSKYCIAYTEAFDPASLPTFVLSPVYQATQACNFAICYGIRILLPAYLHSLLGAIESSWKQVADSQDSFSLPEELSPHFQPAMSDKVIPVRKPVQAWQPDPTRQTLFSGWKVLGITKAGAPLERRYLLAMGAEFEHISIGEKPILSADDFKKRIAQWIKHVDATGSRDRAVIAHFINAKKAVEDSGVSWNNVVVAPCQQLGVFLSGGSICWGAAARNDVLCYLEELSGKEPLGNASAGPSTATRQSKSPEKARAAAKAPVPEPSLPDPTPQALKVPSTFPDESAALAQKGQSGTERSVQRAKSPEVEPAAGPSRKLPKRRLGKPATLDLFSMDVDEEPSPSTGSTPHDSQGSVSNPRSVELPSAAQPPAQTQNSISQASQPAAPTTTRLKRRAGLPPQSFDLFDLSEAHETPAVSTTEETPQEIRDLYEATKRGELPPLAKRTRVVSADSARYDDEDSLSSAVAPASPPSEGSRARRHVTVADPDGEDVEMGAEGEDGEQEDFIQKTLRQVAANRKAGRTQSAVSDNKAKGNMPPPSVPANRRSKRSPSEEVEVVETSKRPRLASPEKSATAKKSKSKTDKAEKSNEPTTDPAFLLAVSKSRSKKAIDEMDTEFNNLRIPKSAIKGKQLQAQQQRQQQLDMENMVIPRDYGILNDFGDEMRGNFIQVVRKDLYRKDGGLKVGQRVEDGRPNFKKFKKKETVKHEPLRLVLVGQSNAVEDDEMGEPYWPGATGRSKSQMTQTQAVNGENEDSLPLLPRARTRKLLTHNEDDEDDLAPLPATSRRRLLPDSQAPSSSALPSSRAPARKTRAASTISEADSVASAVPSARGSRSAATSAKSSATVGRGKKMPIVIDDSDDETEGVKFTATAGTGSGNSRRGRGTTDDPPPSASASTSSRTAKAAAQPSGSATVGRRKLLAADDDDDGMVFKAATKKRRIG